MNTKRIHIYTRLMQDACVCVYAHVSGPPSSTYIAFQRHNTAAFDFWHLVCVRTTKSTSFGNGDAIKFCASFGPAHLQTIDTIFNYV